MKIGDLVTWIGHDMVGVVTYINGYLYQVRYTDGTIGHHYDYNIKVINESG